MDTNINNVPQEMYEQIKAEITNKDSVVGIENTTKVTKQLKTKSQFYTFKR